MKLTVIGAGNMGGALIKGWAKSGKVGNITIADKNEALLAQFKQEFPALQTTTDNVEAVKKSGAEIIVSGTGIINSDNYVDIIRIMKE